MVLVGDLSLDLSLGLESGGLALGEAFAVLGLGFLFGKVGKLVLDLL